MGFRARIRRVPDSTACAAPQCHPVGTVLQLRAEAKDYIDIDALMTIGKIGLPTALAAAQKLYGPSFNPQITLKALSYFDDGNLHDLPDSTKRRLVAAAREVNLDHLPALDSASQREVRDHGFEA